VALVAMETTNDIPLVMLVYPLQFFRGTLLSLFSIPYFFAKFCVALVAMVTVDYTLWLCFSWRTRFRKGTLSVPLINQNVN